MVLLSSFMDKKEEFDKQADIFKGKAPKEKRTMPPIKKKIYYTRRQYIVKLPAEMVQALEYKKGDCLVFTLKSDPQGDKIKYSLEIEYEHTKDQKE